MFWKSSLQFVLVGAILTAFGLSACGGAGSSSPARSEFSGAPTIAVVAAENFYGNIIQQLGAGHVSVVSILSDPNIDPHEYESSVQNGIAVSNALLVILNGDDYDTWMEKLLAASPNPKRIVLEGADMANHKLTDNPHVWYGIDNIQAIAAGITAALEKIDPADQSAFEAAAIIFDQSLVPIQQKLSELKSKYAGTPVGLTETIFLYQTGPIGLNVLTPFAYEKAIAEGNDPPADTVVITNSQINQRLVKVLIYNVQTITPLTTNLQEAALKNGIPIIAVSETMPEGKTYQGWMLDQLNALQKALGG
ncbi:MAG: zinc ABC transporter substrate-binding protein [Anaerolineales bacterium]|jgi:zinc/manganese transport system substrate-binding protein